MLAVVATLRFKFAAAGAPPLTRRCYLACVYRPSYAYWSACIPLPGPAGAIPHCLTMLTVCARILHPAVTLGCSIGDMFQTAANAYAKPHLEASIPRGP
eukprot:2877419-Rhodomonas_salina.1